MEFVPMAAIKTPNSNLDSEFSKTGEFTNMNCDRMAVGCSISNNGPAHCTWKRCFLVTVVVLHPSYLADLDLCDCFLFPKIKSKLTDFCF